MKKKEKLKVGENYGRSRVFVVKRRLTSQVT